MNMPSQYYNHQEETMENGQRNTPSNEDTFYETYEEDDDDQDHQDHQDQPHVDPQSHEPNNDQYDQYDPYEEHTQHTQPIQPQLQEIDQIILTPLHNQLSEELSTNLHSLHQCTKEALLTSWNEADRFHLEAEGMERRIAYLKSRIREGRREIVECWSRDVGGGSGDGDGGGSGDGGNGGGGRNSRNGECGGIGADSSIGADGADSGPIDRVAEAEERLERLVPSSEFSGLERRGSGLLGVAVDGIGMSSGDGQDGHGGTGESDGSAGSISGGRNGVIGGMDRLTRTNADTLGLAGIKEEDKSTDGSNDLSKEILHGDGEDANDANDAKDSSGNHRGSLSNTHNNNGRPSLAEVPGFSRTSMLSMLGANTAFGLSSSHSSSNQGSSRNLLGNSNNQQESDHNGERGSFSFSIFRTSFSDGASDGMPSRWRARELEKARVKREEERRKSMDSMENDAGEGNPNNDANGMAANANSDAQGGTTSQNTNTQSNSNNPNTPISINPQNTISKQRQQKLHLLQTLRTLISQRESEISTLESKTITVANQTSHLQSEISTLQTTHTLHQSNSQKERVQLLEELKETQAQNDLLEAKILEVEVLLDEKKISGELLAGELRQAREDLYVVQRELEEGREKRKREERRARRWRGKNGVGGGNSGVGQKSHPQYHPEQQNNQHPQQQQQQAWSQQIPTVKVPLKQQGDDPVTRPKRYHIPASAQQQYQELLSSSTNSDNTDDGKEQLEGEDEEQDRRQSFASVNTFMSMVSALTLDDDMKDLLDG